MSAKREAAKRDTAIGNDPTFAGCESGQPRASFGRQAADFEPTESADAAPNLAGAPVAVAAKKLDTGDGAAASGGGVSARAAGGGNGQDGGSGTREAWWAWPAGSLVAPILCTQARQVP